MGPVLNESSTIDRRTLAKGAAWAVPTVVVGAAAPAIAASSSDVEVRFSDSTSSVTVVPGTVTYAVTVSGAPLKAGSTFALNVGSALNLIVGTANIGIEGSLRDKSDLSGTKLFGFTLTLNQDLPVGTYYLTFSVVAELTAVTSLRLTSVANGAGGNQNKNADNDSARHTCVGHVPLGTIC